MAFKRFQVAELPVTVYKRKTSRSLRLSVSPKGEIRISIPVWTPYNTGVAFAQSKMSWIRDQLPQQQLLLREGQLVGKSHRLKFVPSTLDKTTFRILQNEIIVKYPANLSLSHPDVQKVAERGSIRALRNQSEKLLPLRLQQLADHHGYTYRTVRIKHLKSRWGSCDQEYNIVLNLFLMQLPWDCIDYVLVHELVHTRVMQHGPRFWQEMSLSLPEVKLLRKRMREYRPLLHTNALQPVS